ncbi:pilus assembly FimT family protein [Ferrimonas pelagia]|uniref:GspH/FimT family pseudopilin n=1 Tax=Ferrimonas pelagia TaxID=1177826 RepID=A0ABP9EAU7_9GAMM
MDVNATRNGFTLIELLIALAVATLLLAVGVPSFLELRQQLALRGAAFQLLETVHLGKSEALKRDLDTLSIKFITPSSGNWCVRVTDTPSTCVSCDKQSSACAIEGDGGVRGIDSEGYPELSLSHDYASNVLQVTNRRAGLTAGAGELILSDSKSVCVVSRALGQVKICTPSDRDGLLGVNRCEESECAL